MQVRDFLREENVLVGLNPSSKHQLLLQLSDLVGERTSISPQVVLKALLDRESLGSTGIGGGIALPHALVVGLGCEVCLVARLARPIDFEAVDDVPADIVVLLLSPASSKGDALNILSCIARCFRDEDVVRGMRAAQTPDELFALLTG